MEEIRKVKVVYSAASKITEGNYPNWIDYPNVTLDTESKTLNGRPYIEITEDEWLNNLDKRLVVDVENHAVSEYVKTTDELLQETKNEAMGVRKIYLRSTDWYIAREFDQPNSYPEDIKDRRTQAYTEIDQIERETDISNITVEF